MTKLLRCLAIAAALGTSSLSAQPADPLAASGAPDLHARFFDMPEQRVDLALRRFVELTNYQLIYSSNITRGLKSRQIKGMMTPRDALAALLTGPNLERSSLSRHRTHVGYLPLANT